MYNGLLEYLNISVNSQSKFQFGSLTLVKQKKRF